MSERCLPMYPSSARCLPTYPSSERCLATYPFGLFAIGEALAAAECRAPSGLLAALGVVAPAGLVVSAGVRRLVCGGWSVTSGPFAAGNVSVAIEGIVVVANGDAAVDAMASVEGEPSPAGSASLPASVSSHAEPSDGSAVG